MKKLALLVLFYSRLMALPFWFEPNQGQAHPAVQFLAHTPSGYVYFAHDKMAVRDVRMDLLGANKPAQAEFEEQMRPRPRRSGTRCVKKTRSSPRLWLRFFRKLRRTP